MANECAGLKVVKNTLRPDWDRGDGPFSTAELAGVRGSVEVEVLPKCILREELVLEIAEIMAADEAYNTLDRCIEIQSWKVVRNGNRVTVTAQSFVNTDPDTGLCRAPVKTWAGFDRLAGLIVLIVPSFLLWM